MRMKRLLPLLLAFTIISQSAAAAYSGQSSHGSESVYASEPEQAIWQLLSSTQQGLTIALTSPAPSQQQLSTQQGQFTQIVAPGLGSVHTTGQPDLPGKTFLIAVPPNAKVEISVRASGSTWVQLESGSVLAPIAGITSSSDPAVDNLALASNQMPAIFEPDPSIYEQDQIFPAQLAYVLEDGWLRNLRILQIQVNPYQHLPRQGSLLWHPHLEVRVLFDQPDTRSSQTEHSQPSGNLAFDGLYQNILNSEQASQWLGQPEHQANALPSSLGTRLSIPISADGIYELNYADLIAEWPELAQSDPALFQMYNQGTPVAIWVDGQADGSFDPEDRILFYGEQFDGQRLAERHAGENENWQIFLRPLTDGSYEIWKPQFNALMIEKYVEQNIYYLTLAVTPGLRMGNIDGDPSANANSPAPYYIETVRREESNWWWSNDYTSEETWFWDQLTSDKPFTRTYTSTLTALSSEPLTATIRAEIVAYNQNSDPGDKLDHHVRFSINNSLVEETLLYRPLNPSESDPIWDGRSRYQLDAELPTSHLLGGQNDFQIGVLTDGAVQRPRFFFDWFEMDYPRQFVAVDNQLIFAELLLPASQTFPGTEKTAQPIANNRTPDLSSQKFQVTGFDSLQDPIALAITNPLVPVRILNPAAAGDALTISVSSSPGTEYIVATSPGIKSPEHIAVYHPDDLLASTNAADYVLITPSDFITATQSLADYRSSQGLVTRVIDIADLYHEFNDGISHPIAIKNFLAYALEYWSLAPSYAVLVGDGHWNMKDYATYKYGEVPNFMPPNLAWVDPYQGEVDATNLLATVRGTDPLADIHIARIPVNTPAEMDAITAKIIAYEQGPMSQPWQRNITFIADNVPDPKDAGDFVSYSDSLIADYLTTSDKYQPISLYQNDFGCFSGQCSIMRSVIADTINITGTLLVSYIGHGSVKSWSDEQIFRVDDLSLLNNSGQYPLVLSMTCLDGSWYYPINSHNPGLIEALLRLNNAGIIAGFSPTGLGVATGHDVLQRGFFDAIFVEEDPILGHAAANAKLDLYATSQNYDLLHTYTIFGDPALNIKITLDNKLFLPTIHR